MVTKTLRTRETILTELGGFPEEFRRLVLAEPDLDDLLRPAKDGGWGVVEVLPHLRDWEEIYLERAHLMVEEDAPHLPAYDDALWAIERDYRGQDPRETFAQFRALRGQLVELLRGLPAEVWERRGEHGVFGSVTLHWLADHVCDHDGEHLQQALDALT
ncbi:MAG: DinB family protein [Thermomicrobiales bacterium]